MRPRPPGGHLAGALPVASVLVFFGAGGGGHLRQVVLKAPLAVGDVGAPSPL
jgi:hypothetical protein